MRHRRCEYCRKRTQPLFECYRFEEDAVVVICRKCWVKGNADPREILAREIK